MIRSGFAVAISMLLLLMPLAALAEAGPADASDDSLVELYLGRISRPTGACTFVGAIINLYPQERSALLEMDWRALPALSEVLLSGEGGLRAAVAEIFIAEILSRRAQGADPSPEADAAETIARDALAFHTGVAFVPYPPNPEWK